VVTWKASTTPAANCNLTRSQIGTVNPPPDG
jgi:hypothetical protein